MEPERDPIREAREAVDAVRGRLLSGTPDAIAAGIPQLESAVGCLEAIRKGVAAGSIDSRTAAESLTSLRPAISRIVHLIDSSARFYHGWWTVPETGVGDYTPAGERATPNLSQTLFIQG